MDYSNFQDWEIDTLAKRNGQTAEEWKAEQDALAGKQTVPEAATPPTEPEKKNGTAAGDSSSADTSLESSETDPPAKTEAVQLPVKKPELSLDELEDRAENEPYIVLDSGIRMFKDEYESEGYGAFYTYAEYPASFFEFAESRGYEVKYDDYLSEVDMLFGEIDEVTVTAKKQKMGKQARWLKNKQKQAKRYLKTIARQNEHRNRSLIIKEYFGLDLAIEGDGLFAENHNLYGFPTITDSDSRKTTYIVVGPPGEDPLAEGSEYMKSTARMGLEYGPTGFNQYTGVNEEQGYERNFITIGDYLGEKKYKEWLELTGSEVGSTANSITGGVLKGFDLNLVTDGTKERVLTERKTKAAEAFVRNLGAEETRALFAYMDPEGSVFGDLVRAEIEKRRIEELDYLERGGFDLTKAFNYEGSVMVPHKWNDGNIQKYHATVKGQRGALEDMEQFDTELEQAFKVFQQDLGNVQANIELWGEQYQYATYIGNQYATKINDIKNTLDKFVVDGKVVLNSQEEADVYNATVQQYNDLIKEKAFVDYEENYNQLVGIRNSLQKELDKLNEAAPLFGDISIANEAILKSYGFLARVDQAMQEFFAGGTYSLWGEIVDDLSWLVAEEGSAFREWAKGVKEGSIDYNKKLSEQRAKNLPMNITWDDVTSGEFNVSVGQYFSQSIADQSPSIVLTLATMGYGSVVGASSTTASVLNSIRTASKVTGSLFFIAEAGGYYGETALMQREAEENIKNLNLQLENLNISGYGGIVNVQPIKEAIEYNDNYITLGRGQRFLTGMAYGATAAFAERFGNMAFVKNLGRFSRAHTYKTLSKYLRPSQALYVSNALAIPKTFIGGGAINLFEETATLGMQNLSDIYIGGFNKSIWDGFDVDFALSTFGQSVAISGPSIGTNLYSGLANTFTSSKNTRVMNQYRQKIIDIQAELNSDKLSAERRQELREERYKVLNEMDLYNADILLKLPDMQREDYDALITIDRDLNAIYNQARKLGQDAEVGEYGKKQLEVLKEQAIQLEAKKDEILGKSDEEILIKYKDAANPAEAAFNYGLFRRAVHLASANNKFNLSEIRSQEDLDAFFEANPKIDEKKKAEITQAFEGNVNALEVNGKVLVFSQFIEDQIGVLDDLNAKIAAVSPLHEIGHIKVRQAGVLNDANILEKANNIVAEVQNELIERNRIGELSDQDLEIALERIAFYNDKTNNDIVKADEAFQLVADLINTGAINKNSFTSLYDFKSFAKRTVRKIFGDLDWTMQLNSSDDMFNFTSSWITQVNEGRQILAPEKEEEETTVKESAARGDLLQTINNLVPETVQTQADFFDRKVFNPIYNDGNLHPAISNYIRNKAVSAEEAQKIIDSVADRLINFNPEAKRKSGDGKITLGEFIFSNVNFGQRDARKALFEESQERAQVESADSEQARQIATVEESTPQVEKPKYKSLTQRKVLSEEAMGPARQKVLSIARVLKSPIDANVSKNVTVTPLAAEIKKAVGKQLDIDFKKEMGGLKDGQLRKYLLKNKAAILENMTTTWLMTAMPNAVQKQVNGVWTSDWKGKKVDREKTSTDNAGRTSGAEMVRRLPKAATRLSDAEFLSNFFTEDGKLIRGRKESLAKAMAEETGFEIIREALNDPNSEIAQAFLAAQERAGAKDLTNIGVKFDVMAERGNVKFSVALGRKLQNIGKGIRSEFDMQLPKNRDKMINKVLAIHGIDPVHKLNTKEDIIAWKEATQKYVLPLLPKWYWFTKKNGEYADSGNSAFRRSARFVGDRSLDGFFIEQINELRALDENSGAFGTVDGISERLTGTYETKLGKTEEQFIENYKNGTIDAFNEYNTKMHAAFWANVNKIIRENNFNPDAVRAIGHYLTLVSNDTTHVHKMGAEFVGYTTNAKGKTSSNGTFKLYEMEHAMPATNAYSYLMDAVLNGYDFDAAYNAVMSNYKLIALDAADDLKLKAAGLSNGMPDGWSVLENGWHERYSGAGVDLSTIIMNNGQTLAEVAGVNKFGEPMSQNGIEFNKKVDQQALADTKEAMEPSVRFSRATPRAVFMVGGPGAGKTNVGKGLKLGRRGFKVINQDLALEPMKIEAGLPANEQQYTKEQRSMRAKLGAAARKAAEAKMAKYMGFGESMVVDGTGASYNATMKKINALRDAGYEVSIVFANTSKEEAIARNKARAERALPDMIVERTWDAVQESAKLYKQEFGDKFYEVNTNELKLGQSLPTEFLNKLYDDLDVGGIRYSNALSKKFNQIVERRTGVEAVKNFSRIQAQMRGRNKGRFKFFIAPGADDFRGLVHYAFAGKGKQGEADMAWFEEKLMTPYFKGVSAIDAMRQQIKRDFRVVTKQFKQEYKMLKKKIGGGMFTYDHALRVYMWDRQGLEVEGLSKRDKKLLLDAIAKNPELVSLADALLVVARRDEWPDPAAHWEAGSVLSDLNGMTEKIGRKKFLQEFIENAEVIFSEENLNKIEAIYGRRHREALEDSLYAMKNGTNRPTGSNRQVNAWLNWINGSTGAIMFFNRRSALLQMLSFTNFINWSDNNMVKAAAAFANQKQYWSDWTMIFNSDKLKERRGGLKQDVSDSEIAAVAGQSKNSPKAILAYLLKIGFTPTQIADSMAIATGGAMFYRNRVNTYLKQGMDQKAAEEQAFLDFSMKSDEAQQSSDPALVSQQQRSVLGRLVLAFANTPMQYTRLMKKAGQDLINGRGRPIENISKIAYYGVIQNFIFSALQSALFALAFDDDDDEELSEADVERKAAKEEQKTVRVVNSMLDTVLRGSGVYGAVASTMKNAIMEYYKQEEKGFMGDHTYTLLAAAGISPPIQSKFRKIYSAIQTSRFEKDNVEARGWALTADGRLNLGPNWSIFGNVLSGVTNVPLDRVVDELKSISEALDERNKAWQRIALALGWKTWDVGVRNEEADLIKSEAKEARKQEGIRKAKETRRKNTEAKKKREAEEAKAAYEAWEKEFVKNQRKNQEN